MLNNVREKTSDYLIYTDMTLGKIAILLGLRISFASIKALCRKGRYYITNIVKSTTSKSGYNRADKNVAFE